MFHALLMKTNGLVKHHALKFFRVLISAKEHVETASDKTAMNSVLNFVLEVYLVDTLLLLGVLKVKKI